MMNDPMARLDAEIAAVENHLEGLRRARDICRGGQVTGGGAAQQLLIAGPKPKKPKAAGKTSKPQPADFEDDKDGVMEINGVDVAVTYRQQAMLELLSDREAACATKAELTALCGGKAVVFKRALLDMNTRLAVANAQVVARKAKGYMLTDIA